MGDGIRPPPILQCTVASSGTESKDGRWVMCCSYSIQWSVSRDYKEGRKEGGSVRSGHGMR